MRHKCVTCEHEFDSEELIRTKRNGREVIACPHCYCDAFEVVTVPRTTDEEKEQIMDTIIEVNCIECREFFVDLRSSECICDPVMDVFYRSEEFNPVEFCTEACRYWERVRDKILTCDNYG